MKFVLAPDSFKESMTAKEVASSMEKGIKKIFPKAKCVKVPMADGGEGTTQALVDATKGKFYDIEVVGPTGKKVVSTLGVLGDGETGILEIASVCGLQLIPTHERNPLITTTYGIGQVIKAALDLNLKTLLIGLGGSATNDGGAGMFQALGGKLLGQDGRELEKGGGQLHKLHRIDISGLDSRLKDIKVEVACDVNNPLTGKTGASYIFGSQKGASPEMVEILDRNLKHYGNIIKKQLNVDVDQIPGSGAAGGLGAGLMAFLSAKLVGGVDLVIKYTNLEEKIKDADYVFTGEGSIDAQTLFGKTPIGVSNLAGKYNIPTIVLAGMIGKDVDQLYNHGITSIINILQGPCELNEALKNGMTNMERTSENIARLIKETSQLSI